MVRFNKQNLLKGKIKAFLFIFIVFFILNSNISNAELIFKQNNKIDIKVPCYNNESLCSGMATCNMTIFSPSGLLLLNNSIMTNNRAFHNHSLNQTQTNETGTYVSNVVCIDGSDAGFSNFNFIITRSGKNLETSESLIYILTNSGIFLVFIMALWASIKIPYSNSKNELGKIVRVTKTKYLKMFMMVVTYGSFLWFLNGLLGVSDTYLNLGLFYGYMKFVFETMLDLTYIFLFVVIIWGWVEVVRDLNIKKLIKVNGEA